MKCARCPREEGVEPWLVERDNFGADHGEYGPTVLEIIYLCEQCSKLEPILDLEVESE